MRLAILYDLFVPNKSNGSEVEGNADHEGCDDVGILTGESVFRCVFEPDSSVGPYENQSVVYVAVFEHAGNTDSGTDEQDDGGPNIIGNTESIPVYADEKDRYVGDGSDGYPSKINAKRDSNKYCLFE